MIVDGLGPNGVIRQSLLDTDMRDKNLEGFAESLRGADLSSIDAFLENNTDEFVEIGKACIAFMILFRERDAKEEVKNHPPADHWLKYIWNIMRSETDSKRFVENKLSIVSFNYDRLIEYYFDHVIANAFNLSSAEAKDLRKRTIPIVHLHGNIPMDVDFGDFSNPLPPPVTEKITSGIRIVHETMPSDDPRFEAAYKILNMADQVFMLGFGYHLENIRRLKIRQLLRGGVPLFGTVYKMGEAEIDTLKKYGLDFIRGGNNEKAEQFLRHRFAPI